MLAEITFWHWWIAAVIFLILETLVPGAIFLWMGAAGAVVGLVLLLIPSMTWEVQLILFAILSIASVIGWRMWRGTHVDESDRPNLNRRSSTHVGRTLDLTHAIKNGVGRVEIDQIQWKVRGTDMPKGTRVKVVDTDGVILVVESA